MTRRPRKPDEHLVSAKLLGHAYGNMGEIATCGGFFTYNVIMTCYGFPFNIYFELLSKTAYIPSKNVFYNTVVQGTYIDVSNNANANLPNFNTMGFTNYFAPGNCSTPGNNDNFIANDNYPDWVSGINGSVDLRAVYVQCCGTNN
jgi:hypothetical protein